LEVAPHSYIAHILSFSSSFSSSRLVISQSHSKSHSLKPHTTPKMRVSHLALLAVASVVSAAPADYGNYGAYGNNQNYPPASSVAPPPPPPNGYGSYGSYGAYKREAETEAEPADYGDYGGMFLPLKLQNHKLTGINRLRELWRLPKLSASINNQHTDSRTNWIRFLQLIRSLQASSRSRTRSRTNRLW
jgi:hypothetical protein